MYGFARKKGFTVTELLLAATIMILVMGGLVIFCVIAQSVWITGNARIDLQQKARIAMETMVRGSSGIEGIRRASVITSPAVGATGTSISFADASGNSRSFAASSGKIVYTDEVGNTTDVIDSNVQALTFTCISIRWVEIDLSMSVTLRGKAISADLATGVMLRN